MPDMTKTKGPEITIDTLNPPSPVNPNAAVGVVGSAKEVAKVYLFYRAVGSDSTISTSYTKIGGPYAVNLDAWQTTIPANTFQPNSQYFLRASNAADTTGAASSPVHGDKPINTTKATFWLWRILGRFSTRR